MDDASGVPPSECVRDLLLGETIGDRGERCVVHSTSLVLTQVDITSNSDSMHGFLPHLSQVIARRLISGWSEALGGDSDSFSGTQS